MDTLFTNSECSNNCNIQRLILNFIDRINMKRSDCYIASTVHGKMYKIFKIILGTLSRKIKQ